MKTMKKIITLSIAVLLLAALGTNVSFAGKPGGGGKGGKVTVESATPNSVIQTNEEDVTIVGAGFDSGSSVRFLVTGTTDDTQIEVGPAQYVSSNELKVHIKTNGSTATVDYDIEVQATSGRKGKGTTLFKVKVSEDSCETSTEKEPAIVYLTETEKTGPRKDFVYTRDIMLSSADGCLTTMLIDDAAQWLPDTKRNEGKNRFIENVSDVRLVTTGNHAVVSWLDAYEQPWMLEYLEFDFDSEGNIFNISNDLGSYVSSIGYLIVEQDIRVLENGDLLAAFIEKEDNAAPRRVVVVNLMTGDEQVLSSGLCHYLATDGNCYNPTYGGLVWDPTGQMLYVDLTYKPVDSSYKNHLVRYELEQTGEWVGPLPIMATINTDPPQKDLAVIGVSLDGLVSYTYLERLPTDNGSQRFWGIVNPEDCTSVLCDGLDGLTQGDGGIGKWTADDTNLFFDNWNIVECLDPYLCTNTKILVRGVSRFDSDL